MGAHTAHSHPHTIEGAARARNVTPKNGDALGCANLGGHFYELPLSAGACRLRARASKSRPANSGVKPAAAAGVAA